MTNRLSILLLIVVLTLGGLFVPAYALQPKVPCLSNFGTKVPVLMVHGLYGGPLSWGTDNQSSSIFAAIGGDGIARSSFDYERVNQEWITNENIGPKLALWIDCLSKNSLAGKGKGKVIVLAHSMGSLAARYALNQTIDGRKLAEVASVITIGAPNEGSVLANLCEELTKVNAKPDLCNGTAVPAMKVGSKELAELPLFPASVPVKAIAGNVKLNVYLHISLTPIAVATNTDLVVPVAPALKYGTRKGIGDGRREFSCLGWSPVPSFSDAPCEHSNLLKMPEVQQEVKSTIAKYVDEINAPEIPSTNFFGLNLQIGMDWYVLEASEDPLLSYRKVVIWNKSCHQNEFRMYCPGFVVAKMGGQDPKIPYRKGLSCNSDQVHDDLGWSAPKVVGTITVDGVQGEHFIQVNDCKFDEGNILPKKAEDTLHGWRFPTKGVLVYDSEGLEKHSNNPFPGIEQLLKTAKWR